MKKWVRGISAFFLAIALAGCTAGPAASEEAKFEAGTYTGIGTGNNGEVEVQAVFTESEIESVEVVSHQETAGLSDAPIADIPQQIVEQQDLNVDIVSGATHTSEAILEAVEDCMKQAGANPDDFKSEQEAVKTELVDRETEVVVVGAGGAGMSAAIELKEGGADVLVIEKTGHAGGETMLAHSNFPVAESQYQEDAQVETSMEEFYEICTSETNADAQWVAQLLEETKDAADWMYELGADLSTVQKDYNLKPSNGNNPGFEVSKTLENKMNEIGIEVLYNTEATELLIEDGKVSGVVISNGADEATVRADAVVLATGGFSANQDMLAEYTEWGGFGTDNPESSTGDGIQMALAADALLTNMDHVRVTFEVLPSFVALRSGGILINNEGQRFVNEYDDLALEGTTDENRDMAIRAHDLWMSKPLLYVAEAMAAQPDHEAFVLFNQAVLDSNPAVAAAVGSFEKADTLSEVAQKLGIDEAALTQTMQEYKTAYESGTDAQFQRSVMSDSLENGPYYFRSEKILVHSTFGGIAVNDQMQVLNNDNEVISNLWAAGETADDGSYAITPLPRAVAMGRIAARSILETLK